MYLELSSTKRTIFSLHEQRSGRAIVLNPVSANVYVLHQNRTSLFPNLQVWYHDRHKYHPHPPT